MDEVKDASVHLVVTSPPYWQLKDYGHPGQIGFDDSYESYINNLNLVWKECLRVLHPGCRLVVNIGDQFARSVTYGRYKVIPIRTEIIKFCEAAGFDYMGGIIWRKATTMNTTGGATVMGSFPHPRNGILKLDYEFILVFKKPGKSPKPSAEAKKRSKLSTKEWNEYFFGHWNFPGEKQDGHLAMFPEELPRRAIRMFSFAGDTVLDPFLGSGTTTLAAKNLDRNSIGYEINRSCEGAIRKKLGLDGPSLRDGAEIIFKKQRAKRTNWSGEISGLPYIFRDPARFDKKADPRERTFGSKITGREKPKTKYYSVKRVEGPDHLELGDGTRVRLLGVRPRKGRAKEAVAFLRAATKGQKIFLRFDETVSCNGNGENLAYVYLRNKTHLNAHLIKKRLAAPDTSLEHCFKHRFMDYAV
ncbi:MAG: site-specific DNA-methyltransferase [Acidobacteriota bacterium]|nr:MAG: site-specific DNA-methyltransferase [Acidobacteriota bacterium]